MCSTGPFSVLGDWTDIFIAHVIIINSEVSTFPIVIIFSVVVCLRCLLHHILSLVAYTFRENREFVFIIIVQFMMSTNIRMRFGLQIVLVCLFVQYTIALSSLCKLIWRHWTYKIPVSYILSSVWARLSIFSPLPTIQYVGLYVFSLPISLVMIERIYILCLIIIIKSEVRTITQCLWLGHETMVSAVCLSIFLCRQPSLSFIYCTLKDVNRQGTVPIKVGPMLVRNGGPKKVCLWNSM